MKSNDGPASSAAAIAYSAKTAFSAQAHAVVEKDEIKRLVT